MKVSLRMAAMMKLKSARKFKFACGGSLISNKHVVTGKIPAI